MNEYELRIKAAELAIERLKNGLHVFTTFHAIHFFERYLKGEDALIISKEIDELTEISVIQDEYPPLIRPIEPLQTETESLTKKKWWQI